MPASEKDSSPAPVASQQTSSENLLPRFQKIFRISFIVVVLSAAGWLWWNCEFNKEINFLPRRAPADWIVFPLPPDGHVDTVVELAGVFRRSFVLDKVHDGATISWRAFKGAHLVLNGVQLDAPTKENWKEFSTIEVGKFLRPGTNELSVIVTNRFAPPALSLTLRAGNFSLNTDESWEVSLLGSAWRRARLATAAPGPGPGNLLYGGENLSDSLQSNWQRLLMFLLISAFFVGAVSWWFRRAKRIGGDKAAARFALQLGVVAVILWMVLLIHNFRWLAPAIGYDVEAHLDYIKYIQSKHALPLANEGWEMFQPPLYYLISALLLSAGNFTVNDANGIFLLRLFAVFVGLANIMFIFGSLRLLFPNELRKQIIGTLLAAFVPAHFYLLHYITNETLAAMFVSASIYWCLRILREEQPSPGLFAVLGLCAGAAMLSKTSALLALPFLFGIVLVKSFPKRATFSCVTMFAVFLTTCSWHYWRVWKHFGNPFIGNWDPALGRAWWQGPGYHTSAYYCSFGTSLVRPIFSAFKSFGDGIYSSVWGDAMCGGCADLSARSPWNYDLMVVGYLLALIPTVMLLTGIILSAGKLFQRAKLEWVMLFGIFFLTGFSILYMTVKITSYAQVKGFYGLLSLLPICAAGAVGLDFFLQKGKWVRAVLLTALGAFLLNTYAAFWIRPHTVPTCLSNAVALALDNQNGDAIEQFAEVLRLDPHNADARIGLSKIASSAGHSEEALRQLNLVVSEHPESGKAHSQLALELALQNKLEDAAIHARQAAKLAPESPLGFDTLSAALLQSGHTEEAIDAGRQALAIVPSLMETHFNLGLALAQMRKDDEAIVHFQSVLQMNRNAAPAHFQLALLLEKKGTHDEALKHLAEAVRLDPENLKWRALLEKISRNAK